MKILELSLERHVRTHDSRAFMSRSTYWRLLKKLVVQPTIGPKDPMTMARAWVPHGVNVPTQPRQCFESAIGCQQSEELFGLLTVAELRRWGQKLKFVGAREAHAELIGKLDSLIPRNAAVDEVIEALSGWAKPEVIAEFLDRQEVLVLSPDRFAWLAIETQRASGAPTGQRLHKHLQRATVLRTPADVSQ